jgi:glutathione S-transferase
MNAPEVRTLEFTRHIRAPREQVFEAFVSPSLMSAWQCPRGMRVAHAESDTRVGGAWRVEMVARDGARFAVGGRYREIERPQRLVYTWQWEAEHPGMPAVETLIEVRLAARGDGTELAMTHTGFPSASMRDAHAHGWASCFSRLNDMLDPRGTAGTLTLLGDPRSSYVRTARMGFAEKGVAITLQPSAPHSPEVLAIHPFGRIPAFRDGTIELWETSAILKYLDESFGDAPLLTPGRIADRVVCEQWVSAVHCHLYDTMVKRCILQYVFPKGDDGRPDRTIIDAAAKEMPAQLAALERAYARGDFLAGERVSFADLFVAPILAAFEQTPEGARLLADMPNIQRAQATLRQRPSFTSTDPARG